MHRARGTGTPPMVDKLSQNPPSKIPDSCMAACPPAPDTTFKTELQHILKRFFQFPLLVLAFQLTPQRRCQVSHCHLLLETVIQHGATEGPCSFRAQSHANPMHRKRNLQFMLRKVHKYLWFTQYQYSIKLLLQATCYRPSVWYRVYILL